MKKYYRIKCIEKNVKWHGSNFWDAGYSFTYTPVSAGHEYLFQRLEIFNNKLKRKSHYVNCDVTRVFDKQQSIVQIRGKKKLVQQFITDLLLSEFTNHFTFKECPTWDINYKSYA